jgi:hypothetical protein
MKVKLLAVLVVLGIIIFPVIFLLAFMVHDRLVLFKTERLREARVCLLTGLENIQSGTSLINYDRRCAYHCQPFLAQGTEYSSVIKIGGTNYQCFLATDGYVNDRGWMGVTTNKVFIFMDKKRAPKIISDSYKAPGWWSGY